MPNPQNEKGFIPIDNEIWEAWAMTRISGEARQVLDVIIRKTIGFHKKEDWISLSQFSKLTGISRQHIHRALKKLIAMNIVIKNGTTVANKGVTKTVNYSFNTDYETWKALPKKSTVPNNGSRVYPKKALTKDIITKENNTIRHNGEKRDIADKFVALYREHLVKPGYAADVVILTSTRIANINARFQQFPNWDDWTKFFRDFIPASKFLRGDIPPSNGHKQFRLDIDWLTNATNFAKIIEMKYHQ